MKKIKLIEGQNLEGQQEYYLAGLDDYEDFDLVSRQLVIMGLSKFSQIDSFHYRTGLFKNNEGSLQVVYHEDVGIYVNSAQLPSNDKWIQTTLNKLVARLNG